MIILDFPQKWSSIKSIHLYFNTGMKGIALNILKKETTFHIFVEMQEKMPLWSKICSFIAMFSVADMSQGRAVHVRVETCKSEYGLYF